MPNTTQFDYQKSIFEILNISELGLVIVDENSRIVWVNGQFALWTGKDDAFWNDHIWASLPLEAVNESGDLYCLITRDRSQTLHLQHWQAGLPSQPKLTVHFFRAVALDTQTKNATHHSIGLPQRPNWAHFLEYEVSRSRRYDNPLTMLKVKLIVFGESLPADLNHEINLMVSEVLKDELRWADMIGHSETGEFLLVLPETSKEATDALKQKIKQAVAGRMTHNFPEKEYELVFGEAHWQKGDSSAMLLDRARSDLVKQLQQLMHKHA
jgi:GGDEF domain-containing protein